MSNPRSYRPKNTSTIQALQFTPETADDVRSWCSGRLNKSSIGDLTLFVPTLDGVKEVVTNEYVCKSRDKGFFVMEPGEFEENYEAVKRTLSE